jgi:spore germination protein KA
MFSYIKKVFKHLSAKKNEADQKTTPVEDIAFSESLKKNLELFKQRLGDSSDIVIKEFSFGCNNRLNGAVLLVDGLVNTDIVELNILKPLMYDTGLKIDGCSDSIDAVSHALVSSGDVKKREMLGDALDALLSGDTLLLVDGARLALSIGTRKWEKRGVEAPQTETVVRGPREGFTETLRVNTALIRRKLKTHNLRLESLKIGEQTKTDVVLAYIDGIVKPGLVEEVKKRLEGIKTDSILDSGYIEAYIEDAPYSVFSTVGNSERPDTIAGRLLEGRAAIIVDGSPFVLTVPMLFIEGFQTAEDYYLRSYFASSLRILRFFCYFITILGPAIYVALTTFHQELIPTQLLFTMTAGLSGVPFPAMVEALIMVVTFDILKEAGIRLPQPIGSAVSIVGALVIGQSAVTAGLIGPFMIIVVSITAIASFVVPSQQVSISLLRYFYLILGGLFGGFGIALGILFVIVYLASVKSFGVAYLSPMAPFSRYGMRDTFVRMPLWTMIKRPVSMSGNNKTRRVPISVERKKGNSQ